MKAIKKLICEIIGHNFSPVWNYDKPFKNAQKIKESKVNESGETEKGIVILGANEWKCSRCGKSYDLDENGYVIK